MLIVSLSYGERVKWGKGNSHSSCVEMLNHVSRSESVVGSGGDSCATAHGLSFHIKQALRLSDLQGCITGPGASTRNALLDSCGHP